MDSRIKERLEQNLRSALRASGMFSESPHFSLLKENSPLVEELVTVVDRHLRSTSSDTESGE